MLGFCLLTVLNSKSQTSTNNPFPPITPITTPAPIVPDFCLPMPIVQNLFIDAKQKKVLESEVNLLHQDILILNQRIQEKDMRIGEKDFQLSEYMKKDSLNAEVIKTYVSELAVLRSEKQLYVVQLAATEKALKKEKRKTKFVAGVGAVVAAALGYLYITK